MLMHGSTATAQDIDMSHDKLHPVSDSVLTLPYLLLDIHHADVYYYISPRASHYYCGMRCDTVPPTRVHSFIYL